MALPPLRKPKNLISETKSNRFTSPSPATTKDTHNEFVIVKLKNNYKLVVSSDAYHGIVPANGSYRCVFCDVTIDFNNRDKEVHKINSNHKMMMSNYPHIDELSENLMRQVSGDSLYCTICNVLFSNKYLQGHVMSELHTQELNRAMAKSSFYQPMN